VAKQEVIYRTVADTGERDDLDAIAPITSGERVGQVVLQRPDENLRSRTEIDRTELEAQKYLSRGEIRTDRKPEVISRMLTGLQELGFLLFQTE
jgi:hypothetical protein